MTWRDDGFGLVEALVGISMLAIVLIQPAGLVSGRNSTDVAALNGSPGLVDLSNDDLTAGTSDPAPESNRCRSSGLRLSSGRPCP